MSHGHTCKSYIQPLFALFFFLLFFVYFEVPQQLLINFRDFFLFLRQTWSALISLWCVTMVDQYGGWNVLMAELVQYTWPSEESGKIAIVKYNTWIDNFQRFFGSYVPVFICLIPIDPCVSQFFFRCSIKCLFTFIRIFLYTHFGAFQISEMCASSTWLHAAT